MLVSYNKNGLNYLNLFLNVQIKLSQEIKSATENFSMKYKIGAGAFGIVYMTEAEPYGSIAVKRIKQNLVSHVYWLLSFITY